MPFFFWCFGGGKSHAEHLEISAFLKTITLQPIPTPGQQFRCLGMGSHPGSLAETVMPMVELTPTAFWSGQSHGKLLQIPKIDEVLMNKWWFSRCPCGCWTYTCWRWFLYLPTIWTFPRWLLSKSKPPDLQIAFHAVYHGSWQFFIIFPIKLNIKISIVFPCFPCNCFSQMAQSPKAAGAFSDVSQEVARRFAELHFGSSRCLTGIWKLTIWISRVCKCLSNRWLSYSEC